MSSNYEIYRVPIRLETILVSDNIEPNVIDPVIEQLVRIQQLTGHSRFTIFTDWVEFIFTALQRNDQCYLDRIGSYRSDFDEETTHDVMAAYAGAFGELLVAIETTGDEVLGAVYEHWGLTSKDFGQHFTPHSLAHTMATMMMPDESDIREATLDDPLRILDPASGSGRLLVAAARQLATLDPEPPAVYTAIDIDRTCAQMTAINFALFGVPGWVIHGDALTLEIMNSWRILLGGAENDGVIQECDLMDVPVPGAAQAAEESRMNNAEVDQVSRDVDDSSVSEPPIGKSLEDAVDISTNQVKLSDIVDRTINHNRLDAESP